MENPNIRKGKIPPEIEELYRYKIRDTPDEITVELIIPENFDPTQIQITLSKKRSSISVKSQTEMDIPPFFEGATQGKIKSVEYSFVGDDFTILIVKEKRCLWPRPIIGKNNETGEIDPQSLFNIAMMNPDKNMDKIKQAAEAGYAPALVFLGYTYLVSNSDVHSALGEAYCQEAIEIYDCEEAMAFYGEYLLKNKPIKSSYAISILEKAAGRGLSIAHAYLGRALSPLSNIRYVRKDAKRALDELKQAKDVPFAMHEIAMLYYNGVGVQKSINVAYFFQNLAEKLAFTQNTHVDPLVYKEQRVALKSFFIGLIFLLIIWVINKTPLFDNYQASTNEQLLPKRKRSVAFD